eukprot:58633_1
MVMVNHFQSLNNEIRKYADLPQSTNHFFSNGNMVFVRRYSRWYEFVKMVFKCVFQILLPVSGDASVFLVATFVKVNKMSIKRLMNSSEIASSIGNLKVIYGDMRANFRKHCTILRK